MVFDRNVWKHMSVYRKTLPLEQDTRSIFQRILTGLNSEFSFSYISCLIKAEAFSLPYLPIARGRIIGFILFSKVLVLCEMQSVSCRIWTCVAVSISYDDNHYTTGTSQSNIIIHELFTPKSTLTRSVSTYLIGLVWFYGISSIVAYLMPNLTYSYILDIYEM